jgi:hypothetical protein
MVTRLRRLFRLPVLRARQSAIVCMKTEKDKLKSSK